MPERSDGVLDWQEQRMVPKTESEAGCLSNTNPKWVEMEARATGVPAKTVRAKLTRPWLQEDSESDKRLKVRQSDNEVDRVQAI